MVNKKVANPCHTNSYMVFKLQTIPHSCLYESLQPDYNSCISRNKHVGKI